MDGENDEQQTCIHQFVQIETWEVTGTYHIMTANFCVELSKFLPQVLNIYCILAWNYLYCWSLVIAPGNFNSITSAVRMRLIAKTIDSIYSSMPRHCVLLYSYVPRVNNLSWQCLDDMRISIHTFSDRLLSHYFMQWCSTRALRIGHSL